MMVIRKPLSSFKASLLEFTKQPGVLRCLQPMDELARAQGINFVCPLCKDDNIHGLTFLFNLPSVPEEANPKGRWTPQIFPSSLRELSLMGEVKSDKCDWKGWITNGEVTWKP